MIAIDRKPSAIGSLYRVTSTRIQNADSTLTKKYWASLSSLNALLICDMAAMPMIPFIIRLVFPVDVTPSALVLKTSLNNRIDRRMRLVLTER